MQNLLIAVVGVVLLVIGFSMVSDLSAVAAGHNNLNQALQSK